MRIKKGLERLSSVSIMDPSQWVEERLSPTRSKLTFPDGTIVFVKRVQGKMLRHRVNGPAVKHPDKSVEYYRYDQLHREDGPAKIDPNTGLKEWWIENKRHREDGPAVTGPETEQWWRRGVLDRPEDDGPAVFFRGKKMWICNGSIHRSESKGPAVEHSDGTKKEWYNDGILYKRVCLKAGLECVQHIIDGQVYYEVQRPLYPVVPYDLRSLGEQIQGNQPQEEPEEILMPTEHVEPGEVLVDAEPEVGHSEEVPLSRQWSTILSLKNILIVVMFLFILKTHLHQLPKLDSLFPFVERQVFQPFWPARNFSFIP